MNRTAWLVAVCITVLGGCVDAPTEPTSAEVLFLLPAEFPTARGEIEVRVRAFPGGTPLGAFEEIAQRRVPFAHVTGTPTDLPLRVPARDRAGEYLVVLAFICAPDGRGWDAGLSGSLADLREITAARSGSVFQQLNGVCLPPPG